MPNKLLCGTKYLEIIKTSTFITIVLSNKQNNFLNKISNYVYGLTTFNAIIVLRSRIKNKKTRSSVIIKYFLQLKEGYIF